MALLKPIETLSKFLRSSTCLRISHRTTMYNPHFIAPTYKKEELDKMYEAGEHVEKAYKPIKAAESAEHNSILRDDLLHRFTDTIMEMGKRDLARKLVDKGLFNIKVVQIGKYHSAPPEEKSSIELDPLKLFHQAIHNCKPLLDLTPIIRGGITYRVPIPIKDHRATFLAIKWLMEAMNDKHRKIHFPETFCQEILSAARNEGRVVKRKQEWHKLCESNKAYAHYRWR